MKMIKMIMTQNTTLTYNLFSYSDIWNIHTNYEQLIQFRLSNTRKKRSWSIYGHRYAEAVCSFAKSDQRTRYSLGEPLDAVERIDEQ